MRRGKIQVTPNSKPVKTFGFALWILLLGVCGAADGQETAKVPRLGFLAASTAEGDKPAPMTEGLREFGYIEGKNIIIEWRQAAGNVDRLRSYAHELVRLKVDIILTAGSTATRAAKEATNTIPTVMLQDNDPVGSGFIASLARPGGNITGLSTLRPEVSGKRLELLKEVIPGLSRVAVLGSSNNPGNVEAWKETEAAAAALRLKTQYVDVKGLTEVEAAFRSARANKAEAILVWAGPCSTSIGKI